MFLACNQGHTECAQLLSSFGARRGLWVGPFAGRTAEDTSRVNGHDALAEWLGLSRTRWSPLHHLEVLSCERTRALLRGGADLHLRPNAGDTSSPLERAQQLAAGNAAASLVVRAAGPWSVASHDLFPSADRVRMAMLARSLYHVFLRRMGNGGWQAVDFARYVLSFVLCR